MADNSLALAPSSGAIPDGMRHRAYADYLADEPRPLPDFSLYRPRRGHPDWQRLGQEAHAIAREVRPKLATPQRGWSERRRRWRAYKTAVGNFFANRRLTRAGREDLRPLYYIWTTLRSCNFSCTYCDDHRGRKYPDLPNEGVLTPAQGLELLRIMRTGTASVYFAGGEPTLRKDLPELTRAARDLDYYPIILNTNGSTVDRYLRKERWRSWLADTDIVVFSLDALDLELLDEMWVYRRPHEVLRNLLILRELASEMRFKLMVNAVVQPGRIDHARDVLDLANDLGIWYCVVPVNVGPTVNRELAGDAEYRDFAELILARKRAGHKISGSLRMNRRLLYSEPLSCRNTLKPHIDYDGHLLWPCKASVNVEPLKINVLDFPDVDALYEHAVGQVDPTRFHGPACNQCGANCNWAQNYSVDAYAHGLRHPLSLVREVVDFLRGA